MFWHDFLYFSKGERRGLIVLLAIIVIAGTILLINRQSTPPVPDAEERKSNETAKVPEKETQNSELPSAANVRPSATRAPIGSPPSSRNTRESVSERVSRLTSRPQPTYVRAEKFDEGTVVELNTADTTTLKKVPGIGSAFANRIVNYRKVLGGYYSVTQLREVYGMDEERYMALEPWFTADGSHITKIEINKIPQDSLQRHPYISYGQARVIVQLRRQKGKLTGWENVQLLKEFTDHDRIKLQPYISFD